MRSIQALTFKALFPLGAVLVLGLVFYPQIVDSILFTPHPAIVFIIFGLMAFGALLLIINLQHLATDHRAFLQVKVDVLNKGQEALQLLSQRDGRFRTLAGLLVLDPLPDSQAHRQACEDEMAHLQRGYQEALSFPAFLSGSLVGLGLVGTFIGLLGALGDIADLISGLSAMNDANKNMLELFSQLVQQLQNPMKSMATAFVASLYGLVGSMTLGFMLIAQRKFTPELLGEWRSLVNEHLARLHAGSSGHASRDGLVSLHQEVSTDTQQWQLLFSQLRAEHKQLIEHMQQLQQQCVHMIWQAQEQHQEMIKRMDSRQQDLQQHTQQQVLIIQAESRELARVLHERNETDALVRRALGEGQHWMQTLMQLQETAGQFVAQQQQQSVTEVAATQASTEMMGQLLERLQRADERQHHEVQSLAQEVRQLVSNIQRFETTARQMSTSVLHNVDAHQQALQESIAKLRTLLAFEVGEVSLAPPKSKTN